MKPQNIPSHFNRLQEEYRRQEKEYREAKWKTNFKTVDENTIITLNVKELNDPNKNQKHRLNFKKPMTWL